MHAGTATLIFVAVRSKGYSWFALARPRASERNAILSHVGHVASPETIRENTELRSMEALRRSVAAVIVAIISP
jgi:hypothetical protein